MKDRKTLWVALLSIHVLIQVFLFNGFLISPLWHEPIVKYSSPVELVREHVRVLPQHLRCINLKSNLPNLLEGTKQVIVFSPAKAGGTSMKLFATQCGNDGLHPHYEDNFINNKMLLKSFLLNSFKPPKIIASHLFNNSEALIDFIKYSGRKSLIIYLYREETDRLMSAIRYVVKDRLCDGNNHNVNFSAIDATCTISEKYLVDEIILKKFAELGFSVPDQLNCDLWQSIDEAGPTLFFINYKKSLLLQTKLAEHYCPLALAQKVMVDADRKASTLYFVHLENSKEIVPLEDWLQAKESSIEFALQISGGSCKHRAREVEDAMSSCSDLAVQVFPKVN